MHAYLPTLHLQCKDWVELPIESRKLRLSHHSHALQRERRIGSADKWKTCPTGLAKENSCTKEDDFRWSPDELTPWSIGETHQIRITSEGRMGIRKFYHIFIYMIKVRFHPKRSRADWEEGGHERGGRSLQSLRLPRAEGILFYTIGLNINRLRRCELTQSFKRWTEWEVLWIGFRSFVH